MAKLSQIKLGNTTYDIGAAWGNITGKPSTFAPSSHSHRTLENIDSSDVASSSATQRYVFISWNDLITNRPAYDTRFTFQTSTGQLSAPVFVENGTTLANKYAPKSHNHDSTYVNVSGDTMSGLLNAHGGISLNSSTAQASGAPEFLLGIKAFAEGGNIIWQSKSNVSVGYADSAGTCTSLSTNAGSTTKAIYFTGGKPAQCNDTINHNVSGYSASLAYPAQITTDANIDGFLEANRFKVATWNNTSSPGVTNGIILSGGWTSTSYGFQIAIDDDPTYFLALRQRDGSGWRAWKRIPMADGTGASGTWGISVNGSSTSCTGNAHSTSVDDTCIAYAGWSNEFNFGGSNASSTIYIGYRAIDSKPIPASFIFGGADGSATLTAKSLSNAGRSVSWINGRDSALVKFTSYSGYNAITSMKTTNGSWEMGVYSNDTMYFNYASDTNYSTGTNSTTQVSINSSGYLSAPRVYGAVWNDYAEFRNQDEKIEPGYCVASNNNGKVYKTNQHLQACDGIVSDTYGFSIGETDNCKTPLAVSGRVLAYYEGNKYDYNAGDTVGASANGKVIKMTREEITKYPDRIVGIVSEIPEYETWGTGNVEVDGRIWIKVK